MVVSTNQGYHSAVITFRNCLDNEEEDECKRTQRGGRGGDKEKEKEVEEEEKRNGRRYDCNGGRKSK